MWDVIFHVIDDDAYKRAMDNVADEMKPGGLLLMTDYLGSPDDKLRAPHVYTRCLATHERNLRHRGFQLLKSVPVYKRLMKSHLGRLDNYLGAAYYCADNFSDGRIPTDNISLGIWRST